MDEMEMLNRHIIRTPQRKGNLQLFGDHRTGGDKGKFLKYLWRNRKLHATKLYNKNIIKGINIGAVTPVRYSGPFLHWTRGEELKQMDQRTRKTMTMHETLHPRDDIDRRYVSRKERGEDLPALKTSLTYVIQRLEDFIEKQGGEQITDTRNHTDNTKTNRVTITRNKMGSKTTLWAF